MKKLVMLSSICLFFSVSTFAQDQAKPKKAKIEKEKLTKKNTSVKTGKKNLYMNSKTFKKVPHKTVYTHKLESL